MRPLLLVPALIASPALASSETDLPPALRADVSLAYEAEVEWAGLEQDGPDGPDEVGRRRDVRHDLAFRAAFAPVDGVAFTLGFDHLARRTLSFPSARRMLQDPVTGKPTSLGAPALDDVEPAVGRGFEGAWLGVAFQPFAERFRKQHQVTWRLDLAVRTAPPTSFFEVDEDGLRGAGVGGPTFRAAAAFSRDHDATSPYMTAAWELQTRRQVTVDDAFGEPVALQVDPGQRLDVRGGIEIRLSDPAAAPTRVDLDLSTGFTYTTPAAVPSGLFLPDVLAASRDDVAVRGERLGWAVRGGLDLDLAEPVALHLWGRVLWRLPWQPESAYPLRTTLDTARAGFGAALIGRIR